MEGFIADAVVGVLHDYYVLVGSNAQGFCFVCSLVSTKLRAKWSLS